MTIAELLGAQRRWGPLRTWKFLADIGMSETKTVGSMTDRQRKAMAALLSPRPLPECSADEVELLSALKLHGEAGARSRWLAMRLGWEQRAVTGILTSLRARRLVRFDCKMWRATDAASCPESEAA